MGRLCSLYLSQSAIMGVKKSPEPTASAKLVKRAVKIRKIFYGAFMGIES